MRVNALRKGGSRPISRVLSRTAIHLGHASPRASSGLPGNGAGHANVPLFGLAPGGVCPATGVATGAVRSYRTFSPLPRNESRGGIFSVALSVGSRPPGVTWHPAHGARTFLSPTTIPRDGAPETSLRLGIVGGSGCLADSRRQYTSATGQAGVTPLKRRHARPAPAGTGRDACDR